MNIKDYIKKLFVNQWGEFYSIKGRLAGASKNREIKSILVTSCYAGEGKTTAAVSMAMALSDEEKSKVLLVDGNFRAPKLHELFGVSSSPGFSDIFTAQNASLTLKETAKDSLVVVSNGAPVSNPLEILSSPVFGKQLRALAESVDNIIVDGTSILEFSDIPAIAEYFDGIVLVVECEKTRLEVVREGMGRIESAGGHLLGVVLNKRNYYIPKAIYGKV